MGFSRIDIGEKILLSVTWTFYKIWQIKQEFCFYLAKVNEPRRKDSLHCHLWKIIGCFFKYFKLCNMSDCTQTVSVGLAH